jgi:hypothetical protein
MLKLINRKIALQWVLLSGLVTFSVYQIFTETKVLSIEGAPFLFKSFVIFFNQYEIIGKGIIIALLLLQIILIQYHFKKNEYTYRKSLLPACFYLSILLLTKSLNNITPQFFTLQFFLIVIAFNYNVPAVKLKNNALIVGIILALATCFDISSIIMLFLAVITLSINHFFKLKEIGIMLFGFSLLYFYFFSYYLFINNLNDWLLTFKEIKLLSIFHEKIFINVFPIIKFISIAIIFAYFILRTKIINDSKIVIQRKRILTLNIWSVMMIACIFISNSTYPNVLGYLFGSISIYLAILAQERNPLYINELITIIILVMLWA